MITVQIQYISFIEPVPGTFLSRVSFPSKGHDLNVYRNGHHEKGLSGDLMALEITDQDGRPVTTLKQAAFPIGKPVLSIKEATNEERVLRGKPTSDLLDNPLFGGPDAQTVLYLPGGAFSAKNVTSSTKYADADWDFITPGKTHTQKLTDTVHWTIALDPAWTCSLRVDKKVRAILAHTETLLLTNVDNPTKPFPIKNDRAEMADVKWLYEFLDPEPTHQPIASTPADYTSLGGELPLCPVGEP